MQIPRNEFSFLFQRFFYVRSCNSFFVSSVIKSWIAIAATLPNSKSIKRIFKRLIRNWILKEKVTRGEKRRFLSLIFVCQQAYFGSHDKPKSTKASFVKSENIFAFLFKRQQKLWIIKHQTNTHTHIRGFAVFGPRWTLQFDLLRAAVGKQFIIFKDLKVVSFNDWETFF